MSRHEVNAFETGQFTVIVGWDNPLQTYFAQVWDAELKDEIDGGCVFWVGTHPGSVRSVRDLAQVMSVYALLPEDLATELEQEKAASKPPTPLQQWVSSRLKSESIDNEQEGEVANTVHDHPCFTCLKTVNPSCTCDWPRESTSCEDCDEMPF